MPVYIISVDYFQLIKKKLDGRVFWKAYKEAIAIKKAIPSKEVNKLLRHQMTIANVF